MRPRPDPKPSARLILAAAAVALLAGGPVFAQRLGAPLGGAVGGVLRAPGQVLEPLPGEIEHGVRGLDLPRLVDAPTSRLKRLVRSHSRDLDLDEHGAPVVRGAAVALSPSEAALEAARGAGFVVVSQERLDALDLDLVVLQAPAGMTSQQALAQLRRLDRAGQYDYDHLYAGAGQVGRARRETVADAAAPAAGAGAALGLVDGGVDVRHPALRGENIEQRGFAPGGVKPGAHGTAVASLLAGRAGRFHGADPGARLYAADVYGSTPKGGAADMVVRGLGWLAGSGAAVINVSLVGPPNVALEAAVRALVRRGVVIVAAVGNDGPAAPPLYPASYPGVIAVTGVDGRRKVLIEAGKATHLDFAAPGADMAAAAAGGGFAAVRGTSFAAPIVAGELARRMSGPGAAEAQKAIAALGREAVDLGSNGPDPVYGRGLVGEDVRTPPRSVGAAD